MNTGDTLPLNSWAATAHQYLKLYQLAPQIAHSLTDGTQNG
jgi:hypothetical protein